MKTIWRIGFLTVTALAVIMELFASFDGNPNTEPWTQLIVKYIPGELAFAGIGALVLWLPIHFGIRYWKKNKKK